MLLSHAAKSSKIPRNEQYIVGGVCIVAFAAENTCATESNEIMATGNFKVPCDWLIFVS